MNITTVVCIIRRIAHRKNIAPVAKSIDVVARGLVKVPGRGARQLFQGPQKSSKCLGFPPYILVLSMTMWLCLWTKLNSSYCGSFQTQLWPNLIEIWCWSSLKTLNTNWHDHLSGCTGVLLSIHQSFPMSKSPFYLVFWIQVWNL